MQLTRKSERLSAIWVQRQHYHYLIMALGLAYAMYMLITFPRWTVDDAYISFRYAYNLVKHGELNWNVGYDPVEGYTGVMLPLLVAPVIAFGGDPAIASQILGLISFGAAAMLLWFILGWMGTPPIVRSVAQTLFLVTPSFYTHVFAGLETMLFSALILASLYALLRRSDVILSILLLLTSLTRPEGVLLALLFIGVRCIQVWRGDGQRVVFLAKIIVSYMLPGAAYFAWRWSYYGYPLPNTFYVKVNGGHVEPTGLIWFGAYALLPLLATALTIPVLTRLKKYHLELTASLIFCVTLFVLYSRSSLIMNYGHRFYMPLYPLYLVMLSTLVAIEPRKLKFLILSLIPLVAQYVWCFGTLLSAEKNLIIPYQDLLVHEHTAIAAYINEHVPVDEWVILNDTGIMPYLTHRKTIDWGALNDEFLARTRDPQAVRAYLNFFHAAAITIPWFEGSDEQGLDPYDALPDPSNYQLVTDYVDPQWATSYKGFRVRLFMRKDLIGWRSQ
jgi:arabinofuranosyltransferase